MAAIQDFDYLGFRQQVRDAFPETRTVPRIDRLMEIDRIRRGQGRPPTQAGEAIRQVYADVVGSLDALFTGINPQALAAHVSRETPSPYYRTPLQRGEQGRPSGSTPLFGGLGSVLRRGQQAAGDVAQANVRQITSEARAALRGYGRLQQASLGFFTGSNPQESVAQAAQGLTGQQTFDPGELGFARNLPEGRAREALTNVEAGLVDPISLASLGAGLPVRAAIGTGLLGSEAAGQAAESLGAPAPVQTGARVVGGLAGGVAGYKGVQSLERARAATEAAPATRPAPRPAEPNTSVRPAPAPEPAPKSAPMPAPKAGWNDMYGLVDDNGNPLVSGRPVRIDTFHGSGRGESGSIYAAGADGPALGEGRYSALTAQHAATFGPNVERGVVQLNNPVVISSTDDLLRIARPVNDAALYVNGPERNSWLRSLRAEIEARGYDGVIINLGAGDVNRIGESNKRLRDIFDISQVIEFPSSIRDQGGRAAAPAASAAATPGRNLDAEALASTPETTPVATVTRAIGQVKPLQEQNAALLTEFRNQQALGFEQGLAQGEGQAGFRSGLAGMRGQAERVSFTPLRDQFDQPTIDGLFNRITQAGLDPFEHANAGAALEDLLAGVAPTPSDLAQLEKAFPGITASLQKAGILSGPGWGAEVRDLAALPQSVVSAFDLSAYRQVATSAAAHPRMFARVWRRALAAAKSEENFNAYLDELNRLPSARLRVRAGVSITRGEQALSGTERTLVQRALGHIPGYKFSTRHYAAVLDGMRAELFDRMVRGYGVSGSLTQKELRQWGRLVNVATGRGDPVVLGNLINESRLGGTPIFWAPRLVLSRGQLPFELFSSSPTVRKEAARQLVAFVGINATLVGVGAKAGLWETSLDPKSADFMQVRIGNQRIDPWAGFRPIANLIVREITGQRTSTITGETTDVGRRTILRDFLQTKLSPLTGTGVDITTGRDQLGNPYNPLQAPIDLLVPLFWRDIVEAAKNQGAGGAAGSLLSGVGFGVNTYAPSPFDRAAAEQGFNVPYVSLSPVQKLQVDDAHPELVDARSAQIIARGGPRADYERLKVDLRAQQEASDANLASGTLTPSEWRDQRGTRLDLLRGAREIVFANAPKDAKDAIGRYYQQVDASQLADGTVDWDAVEVWLTQQSTADQKLIDENTGIGGTQTERTYRSLVKQLDQSGYYALGDGAWASVQAHAPAQFKQVADAFATFGDWAAAAEEAYRRQLVAGGTPSGVAREQATVALQRHPMYRAYLSAFDTLHKRYTQAHPLLLDQATNFGLGSLDAAEKRYLTLVLGQGQTP